MDTNSPVVVGARGSVWHRWDPHTHTPQTVLNDQFGKDDPWESFLKRIETSNPSIRAMGVTDYLSIDCYEKLLRYKSDGRIQNVALLFPNVEMRFGIETRKGSPVNLHLLFSPEDPNHIAEIKRFLRTLQFRDDKECYCCCREDLIRLGNVHELNTKDDVKALAVGTLQFKVTFDQLRQEWDKSDWVRRNCLIAVAAGEHDGTSGLRDAVGSFDVFRKSIEAFAHIIFSANPKQTEFWLGRGAATMEELEAKWNGMKPCLHGSDAHEESRVGAPEVNRFCWLKGDITFESLRQACIEPEGRVHIGDHPPRGSLPGHTIQMLSVSNAPWMAPSEIPLNSGLVAVIGARGSGKTALADLIATGGLAISARQNPKSFLVRAKEHLKSSSSKLTWEDGEVTCKEINYAESDDGVDTPRVQYLSQQFVDDLCSAEGLADSLVEEIERVVFNAHPVEEREGTNSFNELKSLRSDTAIERRLRYEQDLEATSSVLSEERRLKQGLPSLQKQRTELARQTELDQKDRKALVGKGQESRAKRREKIREALEARRRELEIAQARLRALTALKEDVRDVRSRRVPAWLAEMREARSKSGLNESEWNSFKLDFIGEVDLLLDERVKQASADCKCISGMVAQSTEPQTNEDPNVPLFADDSNLSEQTVALLQKEVARLDKLIGIDAQNEKRFSTLNERISKAAKALEKLDVQIIHAKTVDNRIQDVIDRRRDAYTGVFSAIVDLEKELQLLYAPLAKHLNGSTGSLGKLGFAVKRQVEIEQWAAEGEALLDLRRNGPFKGHGALLDAAKAKLLQPWQIGTSEQASAAMLAFIKENEAALRAHQPESTDKRDWVSSVSQWLHSTSHITVAYGLQYDGVDIERLSQGTRGIVLLLLYLAIDEEDDRPLIIDQPEESLDPQSIFDELVSLFRVAKERRQIFIVTHNANLVVNTDADQVIVSTAGQHRPGQLPQITYESGGLESPRIRKLVCNILEGGERAFRARAKRLRLGISDQFIQQVAVLVKH